MLSDFRNKIDFYLRNLLKISKKGYTEENESKDKLFKDIVAQKEQEFLTEYELSNLKENSTRRNYAENLYTIELLETFLHPKKQPLTKVLDIGSKNWFYAKAQHTFFQKKTENLILNGIELDAWRLYSNFHSRHDAAMYYSKDLKGTNYIAGDFLDHKEKYDYIIWILPFVSEKPFKAWGLPMNYFKPLQMLHKAYNDLEAGGTMLIVNQGKNEQKIQKQMLEKLKIPYEDCGEFKSGFLKYDHKRYVSLIQKPSKSS